MKLWAPYAESTREARAPKRSDPLSRLSGAVDEALRRLTPREEQVLRLRYGIGNRMYASAEVGQRIGMSDGRIRVAEARALQKLRAFAVADSVR